MAVVDSSIETLIREARLTDAQKRYNEFLTFCNERKEDLLQTQSRTAFLQQAYNAGTLDRDGDIERNRITLGFIEEIKDFRSKLSNYFGVGDSMAFFEKIKSRDDIILKALEPRVTDRQYLIQSQIKDGNSSIVFKLKKSHTGQEAIALVLKNPELSANSKEDFIKISELRHRNIVKLLDYELNSFPFFVITEYVHGENLTKALARTGARPIAQVVDWLYQIADALDYMRHKGILHTNVRPSKVFIDEELNAMISPFDFNNTNKEDRTFSRFKDVCFYGSPELLQSDGEPFSLNDMCISDQYSLGLVAYKCLTGKELFEGASVVEIIKNRHRFSIDKPYRAAKLSVFPKGPLGQILKKLLNEDPSKRYANLHEVVVALHSYTHRTKKIDVISSVRESYRRCLAKNRMLMSDFYALLFETLPEVKADFQNPKRQLAMLQMAVDLLIDIDQKKPLLHTLLSSDKHKGYTINHFDVFIETLLKVISNNDPLWFSTQSDWELLFSKTMEAIKEVRNETEDNGI